jgi:aspartyl-tRNA(Asn)/glutamyl-tRNA(Gln) amidotransferase subunit A
LLEAGCGYPTSVPTRAALEGAARDFAAAGAVVEPLAPFLTQDMLDGLDRFWRMRALSDFRATPPERQQKILPFIRAWGESAADFSGETIFHGFSQTLAMRKAAVTATLPYDFVIAPTAPITAFAAELASPSDDPLDPFPHISFTVAFNMSEQPALSINCGYSDEGLPIGMQIIGRRFDDLGVLRVASAFEAMRTGAVRPWPEPPSRAGQR